MISNYRVFNGPFRKDLQIVVDYADLFFGIFCIINCVNEFVKLAFVAVECSFSNARNYSCHLVPMFPVAFECLACEISDWNA